MAWDEVYNAAIDACWLKGVKIGRTVEQVEAIVTSANEFDMPAALNFRASYDAMFLRQFPYVEKVLPFAAGRYHEHLSRWRRDYSREWSFQNGPC